MTDEEPYNMNAQDVALVRHASDLLNKLLQAPWVRPAERVTIAKLQHALSRLPAVSDLEFINLTLSSPRKLFGEIETYHSWEIECDSGTLTLRSGGHFYRPSTGGDSFTAMTWSISPGDESDYSDYLESLWMVPDAAAFPESVQRIDLSDGGYSLTLTDEANTLLEELDDEEDAEDESSEIQETDEDDDAEEENGEEGADEASQPIELMPVDDEEREVMKSINLEQAAAKKPDFAYGAETCDQCGCELNQRGFYVDGSLRGDLMWANMCIPCFKRCGEGVGWGRGQLYARQPNGDWRLVAGFAP
jgi:hypothetical protein